jgi:glycosyltransferase involved in cell wall biosynthesis
LKYIWQKNQGRSLARNLGISLSKGKYVAFLDSDDKWHPDKLLYQVQTLEERRKKESDIALVCSSVMLIDGEGNLLTSRPSGRINHIQKLRLEDYLSKSQIFGPLSNIICFRDFVIEVGGFDEDIDFGEDRRLLIKLREKYKFIYLDRPLIYVRQHNVNHQGFAVKEEIDKKAADYEKIIERFPKSRVTLFKINKALAGSYEQAAYSYFYYHDWESGKKFLEKAIKLDVEFIEDQQRIIHLVASMGFESALNNVRKTVSDLLNYFVDVYYINLMNLWPNGLLSLPSVKMKTFAAFCHILLCDKNIPKTRKEIIHLSMQAFTYGRYLRSITTWKILLINLIKLNEK